MNHSLTFDLNDTKLLYMFVMIRNDSATLSSGISWPHYTGLATAKPIHVLPHRQLLTEIPNRIRIETQIHIQIFKWLTFVCLVHFFRVVPPLSACLSVWTESHLKTGRRHLSNITDSVSLWNYHSRNLRENYARQYKVLDSPGVGGALAGSIG